MSHPNKVKLVDETVGKFTLPELIRLEKEIPKALKIFDQWWVIFILVKEIMNQTISPINPVTKVAVKEQKLLLHDLIREDLPMFSRLFHEMRIDDTLGLIDEKGDVGTDIPDERLLKLFTNPNTTLAYYAVLFLNAANNFISYKMMVFDTGELPENLKSLQDLYSVDDMPLLLPSELIQDGVNIKSLKLNNFYKALDYWKQITKQLKKEIKNFKAILS